MLSTWILTTNSRSVVGSSEEEQSADKSGEESDGSEDTEEHEYEVTSWTKCSTRRFVIAFHHFGTPILLFESSFSGFDSSKCQFVSAFYEVDSSFPEFDSSSCLFDSSFSQSWSFWRFVVSIWRFLISTRRLW